MHSDMRPLAPFVAANSLLNVITMESVHVACVVSGVLGLLLVVSRYFARRAGES